MPPPGKKEFRLFLDPELACRLRVETARREAKSTSDVVADLIESHLPKVGAPAAKSRKALASA